MADLANIEAALAGLAAGAVYPGGSGSPSILPGAASARVYRGWPDAAALDADIAAGVVNVSVFSLPGHSRTTTRYPREWRLIARPAPTLTVAISGATATFAGTGGSGQLAGIRAAGVAYAVQAPTAPADVAAALAAVVPGAVASGTTITVPSAPDFLARVEAPATIQRELRRQLQGVRLTIWASTPAMRDAATALVDAAFVAVDFLRLPDGTEAWVRYGGTAVDDVPTKDALWKRNLDFMVEYASTETKQAPTMLFGLTSLIGATITVETLVA